ncbi:hypothetical protein PG985_001197 [Apiospora marii]|uniref:histidine kinase n=1 Tax=Apiospora marii TaxID=335849 RepID=A0ABR1RI75_9PEZI
MTTQRLNDRHPLVVAATSLGLLPQPGFSSIAIPLPAPSLYLSPFTTAPVNPFGQPDEEEEDDGAYSPPILLPPSRSSSSRSSTARRQPAPPVIKGAYTLLCVDDNRPCEVVSNGREAVDMYKSDPGRFRCILMDSAMPVLNGFDAAREIRAFEEESMRAHAPPDPPLSGQISPEPNGCPTTQDNADKKCPHQRPTRRAILVGASAPGAATLSSRYTDAGFDLVMSKPYHVRMIVDLLFGGPSTNIVSLYGGIDEKELVEAGYPLQLRPWSPPCETNVRDVVLGR